MDLPVGILPRVKMCVDLTEKMKRGACAACVMRFNLYCRCTRSRDLENAEFPQIAWSFNASNYYGSNRASTNQHNVEETQSDKISMMRYEIIGNLRIHNFQLITDHT